jgi:hypothetical protein
MVVRDIVAFYSETLKYIVSRQQGYRAGAVCIYMRSLKGDFVEVRKRLRWFLTNLFNIIRSAQCMEREIWNCAHVGSATVGLGS